MSRRGSLLVVGTGYKLAAQMTPEAVDGVRHADHVFHLVDGVTAAWLRQLNGREESLRDSYGVGKDRSDTYEEMVKRILARVVKGQNVCAAFYGHPGVFASVPHEAVRRARKRGYAATMLPGISAEDCVWSDLNVYPGSGCTSFEATDFLVYKRVIDTSSALLLWQVGLIGVSNYRTEQTLWNPHGLHVLADVLARMYSREQQVVIYEASCFPGCRPIAQRMTLRKLPKARVTIASTLYVPPLGLRPAILPTENGSRPQLNLVGLGYGGAARMTPEVTGHLRASDRIFHLNGNDEIDLVLTGLSEGLNVSVAFTGHPMMYANFTQRLVKVAIRRGFGVRTIPGVSATACLYADLGFDPGADGCQTFHAAELLRRQPRLDVGVPLVILEAGLADGMTRLIEYLRKYYEDGHRISVYSANGFTLRRRLSFLLGTRVDTDSLLLIPPARSPSIDVRMLARLGLSRNDFE